jgi:aminoglycoside phosphotransferase (APT) family kinase protein
LIDVCPEIARLPIVLSDEWEDVGNPVWARSSAFVAGEWVVKFAWSRPAAERLEREIQLLRALVDVEDGPPVARVHACGSDPVLLVCPFVPGSPVTRDAIDRYSPAQKERLAVSLARLLAQFHDPMTYNAVLQAGIKLPWHDPQATTNDLRDRLCPMLDSARRQLVAQWCDWTDAILAAPGTAALVHGDFHGST